MKKNLIFSFASLFQIHIYLSQLTTQACTHRGRGGAGETLLDGFLRSVRSPERGLRCEVFSRRTFAPSDGLMLNHEPLNPITVYKIQRGC